MGPVAIYQQDLGPTRAPQFSGKMGRCHQSADAATHDNDAMQLMALIAWGYRSHFSATVEASARRQARCELTVLPPEEIGVAVLRKS